MLSHRPPKIKTPSLQNHVNLQRMAPVKMVQTQQDELEYVGDEELLKQNSDGMIDGELAYTEENVEMILDFVRPYLMNDGGNVTLLELDGPIVKV